MTRFIIRRLTNPTELELDLLERILDMSMKDDPVCRLAVGDNTALLPEYYRSILKATAVGGHLLVASHDYPHNIVGCCSCFGPGKDILADEEQRAQGFNDFLSKQSPDVLEWWTRIFLPQYGAVANSIIGPGVKLASWSLHALAVDPNFRGRGAGRALVEAGEALAKQDGLPMIFDTESERNTQLYEYWGYEVLGEQDFDAGRRGKIHLKIFRKDFSGA